MKTSLRRAQIRPGVQGIDTTVKSARGPWRAFAPRWDMVLGYKRGNLTAAQYTEQYQAILDQVPQAVWDALAQQERQVLLCYCRLEWTFCHVALLIEHAVRQFPGRFVDGRNLMECP